MYKQLDLDSTGTNSLLCDTRAKRVMITGTYNGLTRFIPSIDDSFRFIILFFWSDRGRQQLRQLCNLTLQTHHSPVTRALFFCGLSAVSHARMGDVKSYVIRKS